MSWPCFPSRTRDACGRTEAFATPSRQWSRRPASTNFRFHDTRHHFASWFMMRGGSLPALKELLGHSDIKTTLIYAHLSPAHLRSEVAKTERTVKPASISAQGSAQEVAELEGVSPK